jgi:hypothetical protein
MMQGSEAFGWDIDGPIEGIYPESDKILSESCNP